MINVQMMHNLNQVFVSQESVAISYKIWKYVAHSITDNLIIYCLHVTQNE